MSPRSIAPTSIVLASFVLATGCRSKPKDAPSSKEAPPPTVLAATASAAAPKESPKPACAALEADKIADLATCSSNVVKTPVPDLVDESHALAPLLERLAELERGTSKRPLRIGIYGDSNLTSDFLPGHLRRVLQARYGDAGHGYVSFSRPWGSYRHEDVSHGGYWQMFKQYAPTTHLAHDKQYGFANMAAQTSDIGAQAWAGTTKNEKAAVGHAVSHFELHFLKQKGGGSFTVQIDKKDVRSVSTKADAFEAGIEEFDVEDGPHELRTIVRGDGPVRFFGVSLDRASGADGGKPGIQIDSLGAGALQYERMTWVASDTRRVQLEKRAYDAIFLWLGMNVMFVPPNREYVKTVVGELRAALPNVPILLIGPGDTVRDGETKSDPRIVAVSKQIREVAAETGVAFWDFREAMGGDGAIIDFTRRGLTGQDHIHFGPEGSKLMGDRLLCATTSAFKGYVKEHPQAGCAAATTRTAADAGN